MNSKSKQVATLILAILLEFAVLYGVVLFQNSVFMSMPLTARAILMIVMQWLLLIVPVSLVHLIRQAQNRTCYIPV